MLHIETPSQEDDPARFKLELRHLSGASTNNDIREVIANLGMAHKNQMGRAYVTQEFRDRFDVSSWIDPYWSNANVIPSRWREYLGLLVFPKGTEYRTWLWRNIPENIERKLAESKERQCAGIAVASQAAPAMIFPEEAIFAIPREHVPLTNPDDAAFVRQFDTVRDSIRTALAHIIPVLSESIHNNRGWLRQLLLYTQRSKTLLREARQLCLDIDHAHTQAMRTVYESLFAVTQEEPFPLPNQIEPRLPRNDTNSIVTTFRTARRRLEGILAGMRSANMPIPTEAT